MGLSRLALAVRCSHRVRMLDASPPHAPLLRSFRDEGWAAVQRLVSEQANEGQHLEFKRVGFKGSKLDKDSKRNVAKSVGAFANSDGGLLVLGVACERDRDGVEYVTGLDPIQDVEVAAARIRDALLGLVSPVPIGVEVFPVPKPSSSEGVVVVVAPRSEDPPHQSTAPGQHCYYARNFHESKPLPDYRVRDLTLRTSAPVLEVEVSDLLFSQRDELGPNGQPRSRIAPVLVLTLVASGRVGASPVGVDVYIGPGWELTTVQPPNHFRQDNERLVGKAARILTKDHVTVFPGDRKEVAKLEIGADGAGASDLEIRALAFTDRPSGGGECHVSWTSADLSARAEHEAKHLQWLWDVSR